MYLKGSEGTKNIISSDAGLGIEDEIKFKKCNKILLHRYTVNKTYLY